MGAEVTVQALPAPGRNHAARPDRQKGLAPVVLPPIPRKRPASGTDELGTLVRTPGPINCFGSAGRR